MGVAEYRVAAWLLLLGVLTAGVVATSEEHKGKDLASNEAFDDGDADHSSRDLTSGAHEIALDGGDDTTVINVADDNTDRSKIDQKNKFFFGSYRTMTHIIVTYDTTTVPLFCLSGTAGNACIAGGRRKRNTFPSVLRAAERFNSDLLEGSQNMESASDPLTGNLEDGGKKFFTVWTKVLTTTTLTSTTTNTASTITLSYYCTAGSLSIPPLCG